MIQACQSAAVVGPAGRTDRARPVMTAAHVAVALVAACRIAGVKPEAAFEAGNGRARVMAAAACMARLGWPKLDAARLFRVHPNRLTPSGQQLARVWTEHLLEIAEALAERGLVGGETPAAARFPDAIETPAPGEPEGACSAEPIVIPVAAPAARPRPERPTKARAARPLGVNPAPAASAAPRGVSVLKPVTDRILNWCRPQLARGASVDFLAFCFNVDVEALAGRLEPRAVAA